jgi:predicted permease
VAGFYRRLEERISRIPTVTAVGANYLLPLSSVALGWEPIGVEGYVPKAAGDNLIIASSGYISPDYFRAMGIPLVKGRVFDLHDTRGAPDVTVVDTKLAERFWPGEDPIGKRIRQGDDGPWRTVIGVVSDSKEYQAAGEPAITAYWPLEQIPVPSRFIVVRTSGAPPAIATPVMATLHDLDPELPAFDVATMERRLHDSLARRRFATVLLGVFASVAALLAAIGVYGVITYWTAQRTREIGIRMAIGAEPAAIQRMVVLQAVQPVGVGICVGLAAAYGLSRLVTSMLFGVSPTDTLTFILLPVLLGLIALAASALPARRAARVDPLVAVRQE